MSEFGLLFAVAVLALVEGSKCINSGQTALLGALETPPAPPFALLLFSKIAERATVLGIGEQTGLRFQTGDLNVNKDPHFFQYDRLSFAIPHHHPQSKASPSFLAKIAQHRRRPAFWFCCRREESTERARPMHPRSPQPETRGMRLSEEDRVKREPSLSRLIERLARMIGCGI